MIALCLIGSAVLGVLVLPISDTLLALSFCGIGFFGRGFYINSIIYLSEIGGHKYRAWAMMTIFAEWSLSPFVLSF